MDIKEQILDDGTVIFTLTVPKEDVTEAARWASPFCLAHLNMLAPGRDIASVLAFYSLIHSVLRERDQWLKTKDLTNVVPFGRTKTQS